MRSCFVNEFPTSLTVLVLSCFESVILHQNDGSVVVVVNLESSLIGPRSSSTPSTMLKQAMHSIGCRRLSLTIH